MGSELLDSEGTIGSPFGKIFSNRSSSSESESKASGKAEEGSLLVMRGKAPEGFVR